MLIVPSLVVMVPTFHGTGVLEFRPNKNLLENNDYSSMNSSKLLYI